MPHDLHPVSTAALASIPGADLSLKMSTSDKNVREQKFESKEPLVFAIAYDVVRLKRSFHKSVPGYFRDDVVLGPAKQAKSKHLTMVPDDEGVIEEEDENEDALGEERY
jgi:hypothetical protein